MRSEQGNEVTGAHRLRPDLQALARDGYLTPASMRGWLGEQYRILKRPILKRAQLATSEADAARMVAVTSAVPGEGKTFTVMNLAMSIAMELDVSVLVIDADLLERALTRRMQLDEHAGLSDLILQPELSPRDLVFELDVGNYRILPAGRPTDHPGELISSERMREVIHAISGDFPGTIVLLDTAPLLTTSQAAVVSDLVGQVLVVVEEGRTSQQEVQDAISIIADKESVGLVLNKSGVSSQQSYWPYYGSP